MVKKIFMILVSVYLFIPRLSAQTDKTEKIVKTSEWTEITEGDDEVGHYILETTYEKGLIVASGMWKNWTVTGTIGAQFYIGDNDWKAKFTEWWTGPAMDLYLNKWISPCFGLGLGFTYSPFRGLYQSDNDIASFQTDEYYGIYQRQHLYRQKGHTFNPYVIAIIDIDNVIAGYDPTRFYNVALYAGGGAIFGSDNIQLRCGATFNMGLVNIFRIWKNLSLVLNLRGSLVSDSFDGESRLTEIQTPEYIRKNVPFDFTCGITAGITYRFGAKNRQKEWSNVGNVTKTYTGYADAQKEIQSLKEELDKSKQENEVLLAEKQEQDVGQERIVIKDPTHVWYHVQFKIDKWDITNRELVNLIHIAALIKAAPNTKFSLCGYADKQTATYSHNLMLSENRVNQVFKVLTEDFGVNPEQLIKDYKGGVDLMFYDDNRLSRCVIIKTLDGESIESDL